ncbi:RNA-binding S4 domain-containing protein [Salipiger mucosus]|uniref:Ribosome-associated heat shock protein implicated in the recycling of the 50S subunit n=1 Tax=Salipiger mucosus DSM 16094 TaxID=1123237 RepID=S9RDN1_9RHOB|nr:RNA-binding S4 domain-containing protein [Salipiger mucosus]EPX76240.1 Ribosome-associated heat shock protein implicated in the recycling of the 50S subunit [Salipiger mucosus DSM 16094]
MAEAASRIRLDKWLWHARFFKTRSLAAKVVAAGVRVNGTKIAKPAYAVGPGDVVTFAQARAVRVIRVETPGERRGPASEAQQLYTDLDPPKPRENTVPSGARSEDNSRPTKRDRRKLDLHRSRALE